LLVGDERLLALPASGANCAIHRHGARPSRIQLCRALGGL